MFSEAIKFFAHPETMIRIAARTILLNIVKLCYSCQDAAFREFIAGNQEEFLNAAFAYLLQICYKIIELENSAFRDEVREYQDLLFFVNDLIAFGDESFIQFLCSVFVEKFIIPLCSGHLGSIQCFLSSQIFFIFKNQFCINYIVSFIYKDIKLALKSYLRLESASAGHLLFFHSLISNHGLNHHSLSLINLYPSRVAKIKHLMVPSTLIVGHVDSASENQGTSQKQIHQRIQSLC